MALTIDDHLLPSFKMHASAADIRHQWEQKIQRQIIARLDLQVLSTLSAEQARAAVQREGRQQLAMENAPLTETERKQVLQAICDDMLGLGPLETLLKDETVSDILVNGPRQIYVERNGKLERTQITFRDAPHLQQTIDRLVGRAGRRLDESNPMVDTRLPDGARVNAIIHPLALNGPILSIRRFPEDYLTLAGLSKVGTLPKCLQPLLRGIVQTRLNVLISGGTGSGKTTLLNALSGAIARHERIITIEDAAELQLQQPHVIRLESRPPNIEGKGEITQRDLVRNSLRMRPDRIIVGEVRGAEFIDMLTAMNTGHNGSMTTLHANSPQDAIRRIKSLAAMSGIGLDNSVINELISSAIDVVIQLERMEDGVRRITSISELVGIKHNDIKLAPIIEFERVSQQQKHNIIGQFVSSGYRPTFMDKITLRGWEGDEQIFTQGVLSSQHSHSERKEQ